MTVEVDMLIRTQVDSLEEDMLILDSLVVQQLSYLVVETPDSARYFPVLMDV